MHETDLDEVDQPRCPLVRQHSEEVCSTSEHHVCRLSSPLTERPFLESVSRTQDSRPVVDERQVRQPLPFPRVLPAHRPGSCEKAVREQSRLEEGQFHMHAKGNAKAACQGTTQACPRTSRHAFITAPFTPEGSLASSLLLRSLSPGLLHAHAEVDESHTRVPLDQVLGALRGHEHRVVSATRQLAAHQRGRLSWKTRAEKEPVSRTTLQCRLSLFNCNPAATILIRRGGVQH